MFLEKWMGRLNRQFALLDKPIYDLATDTKFFGSLGDAHVFLHINIITQSAPFVLNTV